MKDPHRKPRRGRVARMCDVLDSIGGGEFVAPPVRPFRAPDVQTPIDKMRAAIREECRVAVDYVRGRY